MKIKAKEFFIVWCVSIILSAILLFISASLASESYALVEGVILLLALSILLTGLCYMPIDWLSSASAKNDITKANQVQGKN